jgi:hypothetical protein
VGNEDQSERAVAIDLEGSKRLTQPLPASDSDLCSILSGAKGSLVQIQPGVLAKALLRGSFRLLTGMS